MLARTIKECPRRIAAALLAIVAALALAMPAAAFAATSTSNTANVTSGNIENQTIVGEEDGNNVTVTNTLDDSAVSPTGFIMGETGGIVIVAVIALGTVAVVSRLRSRKGGDE